MSLNTAADPLDGSSDPPPPYKEAIQRADNDARQPQSGSSRRIPHQTSRIWKTRVHVMAHLTLGTNLDLQIPQEPGGSPSDTPVIRQIKMPKNFSDLVNIATEHHCLPPLAHVLHVITFPELSGYDWYCDSPVPSGTQGTNSFRCALDQKLFRTIVFAALWSKAPPLCAPDFFLVDAKYRESALEKLFQHRNSIPGVPVHTCDFQPNVWINNPRDHQDWDEFCMQVKTKLNAFNGDWLLKPEKLDWKWISRLVVEKNEFPIIQEVIDFVRSYEHPIELPPYREELPGNRELWNGEQMTLILNTARRYWTLWRVEAEQRYVTQFDRITGRWTSMKH